MFTCGAINAEGHTYNWIVDVAPTTENVGLKHEECSICGHKRSEGTLIDKISSGAELPEQPSAGDKPSGVPWWVWLLIILCIVAVGSGITAVLLIKRNSKKQATIIVNGGDTSEIIERLDRHQEQITELLNRDDGGFGDKYEEGNADSDGKTE